MEPTLPTGNKNFSKDFKFVLGLQEASVLAMADGFAQATRTVAFVNVHTAACWETRSAIW